MSNRIRPAAIILAVTLFAPAAVGYIHFPPKTLPQMCKASHYIRLLKVTKFDKDKGVIVFELADSLKGQKTDLPSFKHVLRQDAAGTKPILDWVAQGKTAVMFSIESHPGGKGLGLGYVFIDSYCYSVDYNRSGKYWFLIRAEPEMSACYHGPVEQLQKAVKDVLAGKEVKAPVKGPMSKEDGDRRRKEVNDGLKKNRGGDGG